MISRKTKKKKEKKAQERKHEKGDACSFVQDREGMEKERWRSVEARVPLAEHVDKNHAVFPPKESRSGDKSLSKGEDEKEHQWRNRVQRFLLSSIYSVAYWRPGVQRGSLPRGGNDFRGREGRDQRRKKAKRKRGRGRNGHGEAKARNPWMDETMRREEVEGEEESRWGEREREESAVEMKNSLEPKVTTSSYLQIRENNEADSRVGGTNSAHISHTSALRTLSIGKHDRSSG